MTRPPRADEAFGIYHALNRGNLRATIFHKEADYVAFERILGEALGRYQIELLSYRLMPNQVPQPDPDAVQGGRTRPVDRKTLQPRYQL